MPAHQSFDDVMGKLRAGDNVAAARVFERYSNRLIALARRRLEPRILQKVDPEDVLQSVFRSFFRCQAAGQMEDLETWDNLWGMLVVITLRKCGRRVEYFHAASRDIDREVTFQPGADQSGSDWEASGLEPTPAEAAILTETVELIMAQLDPKHRQVLALSLQGWTTPEISTQVGCTERTVFRILERVKGILEAMRSMDDER
jgi:RNA polymerase sigma-70 factor (ECF subfamily)